MKGIYHLSYKLLKLINSPAFRPSKKINSIKQAIVLLGLNELQKWVYVLSVRDTTIGKSELSDEVMRTSLTRAKMCESIVQLMGQSAYIAGYFMTGMFY